jgi:hypothetical protein
VNDGGKPIQNCGLCDRCRCPRVPLNFPRPRGSPPNQLHSLRARGDQRRAKRRANQTRCAAEKKPVPRKTRRTHASSIYGQGAFARGRSIAALTLLWYHANRF